MYVCMYHWPAIVAHLFLISVYALQCPVYSNNYIDVVHVRDNWWATASLSNCLVSFGAIRWMSTVKIVEVQTNTSACEQARRAKLLLWRFASLVAVPRGSSWCAVAMNWNNQRQLTSGKRKIQVNIWSVFLPWQSSVSQLLHEIDGNCLSSSCSSFSVTTWACQEKLLKPVTIKAHMCWCLSGKANNINAGLYQHMHPAISSIQQLHYSHYILGHHNEKFAAAGKQASEATATVQRNCVHKGCIKAGSVNTTLTYMQSGRVPGQGANTGPCLQLHADWACPESSVFTCVWARLGCVALAVLFSGSNCHVEK